ncbi:MAG: carboxypeptidase regulatory-like domain-containing protein [Acidobacteria bacterium]|nr:carboxypeptidase regulatory-like domain-containing protein [Acidobacteriota bacterium]MBI3428103.1 carboxypeptidase regulatory-like domain-containing protein [Acidobacteriota bacterium]
MNSRHSFKCVLLLLGWLGLSVLPGWAQSNQVRGKVRLPSGETIAGVVVELWQNGARMAQTVTTRDGDFTFNSLAPAEYQVIVNYLGYQRAAELVTVAAAKPTKAGGNIAPALIEIQLKEPPPPPAPKPAYAPFTQTVPFAARLFFTEAQARFKAAKPAEGLAKLKEALTVFPDYFDALFTLANEAHKSKDDETALATLERARKVYDGDARIYRLFGLIMSKQQKYLVAEFAFREALQRDPAHAQSYQAHGITLLELGLAEKTPQQRRKFFDQAEQQMQTALKQSGHKLLAVHLNLAEVYEARGENQAAIRELETYLKLQPNTPNAAAIRASITRLSQ